jgi:hypothetical protein
LTARLWLGASLYTLIKVIDREVSKIRDLSAATLCSRRRYPSGSVSSLVTSIRCGACLIARVDVTA